MKRYPAFTMYVDYVYPALFATTCGRLTFLDNAGKESTFLWVLDTPNTKTS